MAEKIIENQLTQRIKGLMNAGFHGGAWHGPSVLESLKNLTPKEASFKAPGIHTIAELIYHITSWRIFTLKRLQGDSEYQIDTDKKNFGPTDKVDQFELETLLMELSLSHDELLKEMDNQKDGMLDTIVPGSEYTYYTLLHGIIQHDIYHTGQIILLKKLAANKLAFSDDDDDFSSSRYFDDGLGDAY